MLELTNVHRPPPGTPLWQSAVTKLHSALRASPYRLTEHIPAVLYPIALPFEILNMCSFAIRRRRLIEGGVPYGLYRMFYRLRNLERHRLVAFFLRTEALPVEELRGLLRRLPGAPDAQMLLEAGVIEAIDRGQVRSCLRFASCGNLLVVADHPDRRIADYVYIGGDSLDFAERLRRALNGRRFQRALDLCCGTGIQALTIAQFADQVEGSDINLRAIDYANLNAALHGLSERVRFSVGNLSEKLEGPYDLIVANPPFVYLPQEDKIINRDGYGGELGLEIVERIMTDLDRLLGPNGEAMLISDSPFIAGESSLRRLAQRVISRKRLGAKLTAVQYSVHRERAAFQRAKGISHVIHYFVHVSRSFSGIQVAELPVTRQLTGATYAKIASWVYGG
jgi:SAM-dependent methyltransferase